MAEWQAAWRGGERLSSPRPDGADRGLAYGDGLFETMRAHAGALPWWPRHRARLARGAARLGLPMPADATLDAALAEALGAQPDGVVKLMLTRGTGPRGYAPPRQASPTLLLSAAPPPAAPGPELAVDVLDLRLGVQPALAGLKHLNRLEQVLGAAEAAARGLDDGLMADSEGRLTCSTRANLFAVADGAWVTPPVDRAGVAGIAREVLLETWRPAGGLAVAVLPLAAVPRIEALFLANAVRGILPVGRCGERLLAVPQGDLAAARAALAASHPGVPRGLMRSVLRSLIKALLLAALLASVAALFAWQHYERFRTAPAGQAEGSVLHVERGDGFRVVLSKLRAQGATAGHDLEWKLLAMQLGAMPRLQVGEYALDASLGPEGILRKLMQGDVIRYRLTIVEGWSMRDLRAAIARHDVLVDDIAGLDDATLMDRLGRRGVPAEGRFLPETYVFVRGDRASDVLGRAAVGMDEALAEAWATRQAELPLAAPEDLLTLASIVEKETGRAGERGEIAGVFVRRLRLGMKLQTDPTVIYGIGAAFDGNLRRRDLETDTPWNTYTRFGLPPTPIAMPGRAALRAAARPEPGETLYFVSRGDGSHQFSRTYAEHQAAVRRFQLGGR